MVEATAGMKRTQLEFNRSKQGLVTIEKDRSGARIWQIGKLNYWKSRKWNFWKHFLLLCYVLVCFSTLYGFSAVLTGSSIQKHILFGFPDIRALRLPFVLATSTFVTSISLLITHKGPWTFAACPSTNDYFSATESYLHSKPWDLCLDL